MSTAPLRASASPASRPQLQTFFDEIYCPQECSKLSDSRTRQYRQAVKRAVEFGGDDLSIESITLPFLNDFTAHLRTLGVAENSVVELISCIARIARSWSPAALPGVRVASLKFKEPPTSPPPGSLREYLEEVYIPQAMIGCIHSSIVNTRAAVASLYDHYGRDVLLSQLNDSLIADHFRWLLMRGMKAATVNSGYRATIFSVWRHAFEKGMVETEPKIKKLREERHEPDAWSVEEMAAIVRSAGQFDTGKTYNDVPRNLFWQALILTAWYTGLRRSALFQIHTADLNLSTGLLVVPPSRMKNRRGKTFRLGADAIEAIKRTLSPPRKLLFRCDSSANLLGHHFDAIVIAAGISLGTRKGHNKFHKIRRSTATAVTLAAGEATASALLGHSSSVITQRYIDPSKMPGSDVSAILPTLSLG